MPLGRRFLEEFFDPDLRRLPDDDFDFGAGLVFAGLASASGSGWIGSAGASATAATGFVGVGGTSLMTSWDGDDSLGEFEVDVSASGEFALTRT
tara:strand:- start:114 stop:395 length:282 start_codon:yes stop_codon:yes gene_type:complete